MAMAMDQQVFGCLGKLQVELATLVQLVEEFVDGENPLGHERRVCPWHEVEVVLSQGQNAAWLNTDDRYTLAGIGQEQIDIVLGILPALLDLPLRDSRSAAAFTFHQHHRKAGRFE